jgi:hypothetical protein
MNGSDEGSACAACGGDLDGGSRCEVCGGRAGGVALTVLPRELGASVERPAVKLVRELKMPTLDRLDLDADGVLDRLPGAARSLAEAVADDDLAAADRALDDAIGAVIAGPGHVPERTERRERGVLATILWSWCVVLFLLFVLNWLTSS